MASIKDFDKLFATKPVVATKPHIMLDGFRFRLLGIEPYHEWIMTGELKPDGSPRWAQDPENVVDETGERIRCKVELQLTDANGLATSTSAPFVNNRHYFSYEQLEKIVPKVGDMVELVNPRIELIDVATESKTGRKYIETKMVFMFDDIEA